MTWEEAIDELDPLQKQWAEKIAELAGTYEADFAVFRAAAELLAEFQRQVQGINQQIEQLSAAASARTGGQR